MEAGCERMKGKDQKVSGWKVEKGKCNMRIRKRYRRLEERE